MSEVFRPGGRRTGETGPLLFKKGTCWIVPLVGMGCILVFLLAVMLREPVPGTTLVEPPAAAVGRWVTDHPRYEGRGLRIGARDIVLELGPDGGILRGGIRIVSVWKEAPFDVVRIEYDAGEGPMVLEMLLEGNDRMHLRNPPDVTWNRVR